MQMDWLKRHFIPHAENEHRPHFLHGENSRHLLGIALFFELVLFVIPFLDFPGLVRTLNLGAVLPGVLSTLTNENRLSNNLPPLVENPLLTRAAELKAEDMAAKGYFAHVSPEGKTSWYWFEEAGYNYAYAGENLAVNFVDSEDVAEAWINSPTHRANIVGKNYTEVGTGMAVGIYKGQETIFIAQLYGTPTRLSAVERVSSDVGRNPIRAAPSTNASQIVLGEASDPASAPTLKSHNFIERLLSSPKETTDAVLWTMLSLVLVATFLAVAVKLDHQHPDLIVNGLVVAVIIFAIHIGNGYLAGKNLQTSFVAFENHVDQN
jgi:hypothetical protein